MTFEEFVGVRLRALVRYATVVTWDPDLAGDVVQEVLVRARTRWPHVVATGDPERHLRRLVVQEAVSWRRRTAVPAVSGDDVVVRDVVVRDVVVRDVVVRVVAQLSPRRRAVLALRLHEELSIAEIADVLSCRAATVRADLAEAYAALRAALPDDAAAPAEVEAVAPAVVPVLLVTVAGGSA